MPAHLIAEEGPLTGLIIDFTEGNEWTIGRDPDVADFILEDSTVSRKHVLCQKREDGIYVKNLSQVNPATVNDLDINQLYLLKEGDQLRVGHTLFLFSEEDLPELTPSSEAAPEPTPPPKEKTPEEPKTALPEPVEEPPPPEEPPQREAKPTPNVYDTIFDDLSEEELSHTREEPEEPSPRENQPKNQVAYDTIFEEADEPSEDLPFNFLNESPFILKVISGPNTGAEIGLEKNRAYIIGKDANSCDIIFQDLSVSRNHARLSIDGDGNTTIEDLGSKNKTFVNSSPITEKVPVTAQDFVSLGTTTFLVLDREAPTETIYSPIPSGFEYQAPEEEEVVPQEVAKKETKDWKSQIIPGKYLVFGGAVALILFIMFLSFFSLFKSHQIEIVHRDSSDEIEEITDKFKDVQYSYTPSSGKLFLVGHVLTPVDHQELLYRITQLDFVTDLEDHVIIDEYIWKNVNEVLAENEAWRGVHIRAPEPGKFVATGYVITPAEAEQLQEYLATNFPYLELLENQVVVENILTAQIESMLEEKGFAGIKVQLSGGELILAGRYSEDDAKGYRNLLDDLKKLPGIRTTQSFAISSSANTARINVTEHYKVSGYAMHDHMNFSVVVNGMILTLGDALDGMMITDIEPKMILLEKDGLKYKIDYSR